MRPHIQSFIPGTEPPPDPVTSESLDEAVYAWLDARAEQRRTVDATKIKHATLLAALAEREIERYPYTDRFTGKKRYVVITKEPRAKSTKAPSAKVKREKKRRERDVDETGGDQANAVEHRRVSRAGVESEIDPFAGTRAGMES